MNNIYLKSLVTMARDSGKKNRWPHCQERTQCSDTHRGSESEVPAADEMATNAIFDQEIEDDQIKQARNQAR